MERVTIVKPIPLIHGSATCLGILKNVEHFLTSEKMLRVKGTCAQCNQVAEHDYSLSDLEKECPSCPPAGLIPASVPSSEAEHIPKFITGDISFLKSMNIILEPDGE